LRIWCVAQLIWLGYHAASIKFSVFETGADRSLSPAAHGEVEGIGTASRLSVTDPQGRNLAERPVAGDDYESAIAAIHNCCAVHIGEAKFAGIGHRVVHGGSAFSQPVLIDAQVVAALVHDDAAREYAYGPAQGLPDRGSWAGLASGAARLLHPAAVG
jgi:acetate kinase